MVSTNAIERLAEASQKLNRESNDLNEIIATVEQQIVDLSPGVTAWLEATTLDDAKKDEGDSGEYLSFHELGFDKDDKEWGFFVRRVKQYVDPTGDRYEFDEPVRLRACSRAIRLAATRHFDALIERIAQECESLVASVRKAREKAQLK